MQITVVLHQVNNRRFDMSKAQKTFGLILCSMVIVSAGVAAYGSGVLNGLGIAFLVFAYLVAVIVFC